MRKIAFVFPGQGSQYVGMGKEIYTEYSEARTVFDKVKKKLGIPLKDLCFNGPGDELRLTVNTQPAILTVSVAILKTLELEGIKPDYTAGHSLGEYSALVAAGALEYTDAAWLVRQRGAFMQEAVPPGEGTMAAILGLEAGQVELLCQEASAFGLVEPANYNAPGQIVIAGARSAVEKAMELAKGYGAKKTVPLSVSGPFHSSMLQPASMRLAMALDQVVIRNASVPLVANISAEVTENAPDIRDNLVRQVSNPVKWQQSVEKLRDLGVNTYIEIGPGKVLSGLIKKIDKKAEMYNIEDIATFLRTVAALKEGGPYE